VTPFLTAEWVQLAMLNYDVPPDLLQSRVPKGTELDPYNGRTLVSMVGFLFRDTRVRGFAIPFHRTFEEVNLRFYIRRGDQRAVAFLKEIVPRPAIAVVARTLYNEPYIALPMRHRIEDRQVQYRWHFQKRWHSLYLQTTGDPFDTLPGSEEEFITEHYWGYTKQRDGSTIEYKVEHPKWRVWKAAQATLDCDIAALYGPEFVPYLTRPPSSAFLAEGSKVAVYPGTRISSTDPA
jgi:uncharacterized protein YqjF (DUF2071 family)